MAKKQESSTSVTESVTMDTRKFLSAINNSAQAQIAFFEDAIQKLGEGYGRDWQLTALHTNRVFFEDLETHEYFVADHNREKGGRVKINSIKKLQLQEDKKPELFENSCFSLVEAIEKGDSKEITAAYNKVAASRFRSTAIPSTGIVKTKDGVVRQVAVEDIDGRNLADRILEGLSDQVTINEDGHIEGSFATESLPDPHKLGVTELTTRRLVARYMREAAQNAYRSTNFQTLVEGIAGLICKDDLGKAVAMTAKFMSENQEFCLLNEPQWQELVESALAVKACFNEDLARDTATLMRKTNLKVNREELVDAWRKTAERAEHPVMLENVDVLAESENFEEAYEEFLPTILEVSGDTAKGALIAGLEMLKQKVSSGEVDQPTAEELDQIIQDLKTKGDSAATWKAMETLDSVRRGVENLKGMEDFDSMPGPLEDEVDMPGGEQPEFEPGEDAEVSGGGDKPLEVTVKMDPAKIAASAQGAEPEAAAEEGEAEDDEFDLGALDDIDLEGEGEEEAGGEEDDLDALLAAGKNNNGNTISEDEIKDFLKNEFPDDEIAIEEGGIFEGTQTAPDGSEGLEEDKEDTEESEDTYTLPEGFEVEGEIDLDYQTVIHEEGEFGNADVAEFDKEISNEDNIDDPNALQAAAEAWIRQKRADQIEGMDPEQQQDKVVDMAGKLIAKRMEARQQGMEGKETEDDSIEENQYKSPIKQLARRGLKKAAVSQLVKEGNLRWLDRSDDGVLGEYKGVKFILDHSESPLAVLSEDGEVVVNVPDKYAAGAMYLAEASDDEAIADGFVQWLDATIESLNREEDKTVDEEIDKIASEASEPHEEGEAASYGKKGAKTAQGEEGEAASYGKKGAKTAQGEEGDDDEEDVAEGKLPPELEKHKFKKKQQGEEGEAASYGKEGAKTAQGEEGEESDDDEESSDDED